MFKWFWTIFSLGAPDVGIGIILTCGATTKTEMNTKRIKLIHTKERKNKKNEPIPAPK